MWVSEEFYVVGLQRLVELRVYLAKKTNKKTPMYPELDTPVSP